MLNTNEKYVICVDSEYLVACPYVGSSFLRFSNSPYDGYPFDDFTIAQRIAQKYSGIIMKHNRVTGELTGGWVQ